MQTIDIPIKRPKSIKELIEIVLLYSPICWRNLVRIMAEITPPVTPPDISTTNTTIFFILAHQSLIIRKNNTKIFEVISPLLLNALSI